jgi:predicted small secreted protein
MKTLLIVLTALSITACGTVAGLGKDIQKGAEWTRDQMTGTPL